MCFCSLGTQFAFFEQDISGDKSLTITSSEIANDYVPCKGPEGL